VSVIQSGDLYLGNAYAAVWAVTRFDTVTGQYVPLTGATCTVELVDGGPHFVAPVPLPETAVPGTYATTIPASVIDAAFGHGPKTVTEILKVGTAATIRRPLRVQAERFVP